MRCKTVNKKLVPYFNNEFSVAQNKAIKNHLAHCKTCFKLYSELEITFNLIEKKETLKPNPFLYTRINQQLIDIKNKKRQSVFIPVYKKVLQPVLLSLVLSVGLWGGIKLGNIYQPKQQKQLLVLQSTELYFNDLEQEKIETILLNE